ncbi:MAG TPA: hypothetical protein VGK73_32075 [Polyangiaceae bacterium]
MTSDDDALARRLTLALKAPASRDFAPHEARRRVAARLAMSGGLLTLGASVSGASHAAASGAVASTAPMAPAALALPGMFGLTKVLATGLLLGTTASLGVHALTGGFDARRPAAAPQTHEASGVLARAAEAKLPPAGSNEGASPTPAGETVERARSGVEARSPASQKTSRTSAVAETPHERGMAEQQALLDEARAALRGGDATRALSTARAHHERFPDTVFEEERRAVVIRALLLLGRERDARVQLTGFEHAFPKSLLLPSLRKSVEARFARDSVTESRPSPQSDLEQ